MSNGQRARESERQPEKQRECVCACMQQSVRGERDARETEKGRDSRKQKDGQTEKSAMNEMQRENTR